MKEFKETLYSGYGQFFTVDKVLFEQRTEHQHLVIFENGFFGRVMALDGIIQTTQLDEFAYHEMLTHVPLLSHDDPRNLLIIGGGDGGIAREACRHPCLQKIDMVEIDASVVEMAKKYFPDHSAGAFDDSRLQLHISGGAEFIRQAADSSYDAVISDSTDPIGVGESLFASDFYSDISRILKPGGIFTAQNGVPFFQKSELQNSYKRLGRTFDYHGFYTTVVPTYIGGFMTLAWGGDNSAIRTVDEEILAERLEKLPFSPLYYTPAIHKAAFQLPQHVINLLDHPS